VKKRDSKIRQAMDEAADWLCDAPTGSDQRERGEALRKAMRNMEAVFWQACMVQGLLGFDASTKPEQVNARVQELLRSNICTRDIKQMGNEVEANARRRQR